MFVIRPIEQRDLSALEAFSLNSSIGITSLPPDRALLHQKIIRSQSAFSRTITQPGNELYQFVLEDTSTQEVVGTSAILASIGCKEPVTFFRLLTETKHCRDLNFCKKHLVIDPISYEKGPSEVCTLYLSSSHRKGGLGYLLSLSRFLFMAAEPHRFQKQCIAQMRGVIDEQGYAPFYEHVTKRFFDLDFCDLMDVLTAGKQIIDDLLPHQPIYLSLMDKEAREVVSQTHKKTSAALRVLQSENFTVSNEIDLFDGGPKAEAPLQEIRTIKESRCGEVARIGTPSPTSELYLLSNNQTQFRACLGHVEIDELGLLCIDEEVAHQLQINRGDQVRYVTPKSKLSKERAQQWEAAQAEL